MQFDAIIWAVFEVIWMKDDILLKQIDILHKVNKWGLLFFGKYGRKHTVFPKVWISSTNYAYESSHLFLVNYSNK